MKLIVFILIIFSSILISGCQKKDKWQAVFYPNGCLECEDKYIYSPVFENSNDCINWAERKKLERNNPNDDYECGKNCRWEKEYKINVCEETL